MLTTARRTRALTLLILLLGLPAALHAQTADAVEVASGERIKGDISRLDRGRLEFQTARAEPGRPRFAGTISIIWSEVVSLSSEKMLDVMLVSGQYYAGTISSPKPGTLVVQTATGPTMPIDFKDVVWITPISDGFRARTTGSIDFGLEWVHAENARSYTLNAEANHRSADHAYETKAAYESYLAARDNAERLTRNDGRVDVERRLVNRWFVFGKFQGQQDQQLQLDARFIAGGGIGRRLAQTNRGYLSLRGGFNYDGERYSEVGEFDHSGEALAGLDFDWFEPGSSLEATLDANAFFNLSRTRFRAEWNASVRKDVFWDLYWAVNFFSSHDSDPPEDTPHRNLGLSITLGWTF
jgi:putative salt-induced outer membrane protein YdiY